MTLATQSMEAAVAVGRFGLGARPGELAQAGVDPRGWLKAQITPKGVEQPPGALPTGAERFATYIAERAEVRQFKQAAAAPPPPMVAPAQASSSPAAPAPPSDALKAERRAVLAPTRDGVVEEILARTQLAASTASPFAERWTLFWSNHFTVSTTKREAAVLAGPFEREAIRPYVFGRFETLLVASTTHPGMLLYLDQARSTGPNSPAGGRRNVGLNENLAREVMELHTVGADSGYTQADVTEFARALTGYSVGVERDGPQSLGRAVYRPTQHEPGQRTVMGQRYAPGQSEQARAVLADLAASPHTADQLARKLAIHFVADDPPRALIDRLRSAYLDSRGDLAVVATALIEAPQAWSSAPQKFKRPYEFMVSGYRAVGAVPASSAEVIGPLTQLGERPFAAPQPNGWSEHVGDWAAPDAVVKRLDWSARFSAAHASADVAPVQVAYAALGARLTPPVETAIARAETGPEALTLMLMSPEFQRR